MLDSKQILTQLRNQQQTLQKFAVKKIGLFGSYLRNEARQESDIDILVDLEKKTFDNYMDLKDFLESLFGKQVDLVLSDSIKPTLKEFILNEVEYTS